MTLAQCECGEFENTGFPCGNVCLLNYKGLVEEMRINERWYKTKGDGSETGKQTTCRFEVTKSARRTTNKDTAQKSSRKTKSAAKKEAEPEPPQQQAQEDEDTSMEEQEDSVIKV